MNNFVYVVSLAGEQIRRNWCTQCVIKDIDILNKIRIIIKKNIMLNLKNLLVAFHQIGGNLIILLTIVIFIL